MSKIAEIWKRQWFSLTMLALFLLAWLSPETASFLGAGGWSKSGAVVLIFFLSGLNLSIKDSLRGITNWRLHLYVQAFSFVLLPLGCWVLLKPWQATLPEGIVMGFYLLAVLPTTITSCAVLTQLAGGSFSGAVFNAVGGNIIGIFISPALLWLMIGSSEMAVDLDATAVFLKLGRLVLLPLAAGQITRTLFPGSVGFLKKRSALLNRLGILLIIYLAFGKTFIRGLPAESLRGVVLPLVLIAPAHIGILWLAWIGTRLLKFTYPDRIAALFCAPQKTLALGLPLVYAALGERPDLVGLAALPIIVYHPVQLFVAGLLVDRLKKR